MHIPRRPLRFPWRERNRVELLAQGTRYLPAMLEAIDQAHSQVALEFYWFETGRVGNRFIRALSRAAARGVRVMLLVDDYGGSRLDAIDRRRLANAGVHLVRFNPLRMRLGWGNLVRDHRKLLLVDDRVAFVGGSGIADVFDGESGWRENMLRVEGECVADWWRLFRQVWLRGSALACPLPATRPAGPVPGRVVAGGGGLWRAIFGAAIGDIRRARERVWLATPYFLPPVKMRRELARARRRGCDVRLLLPDAAHCDVPAVQAAGRRYYDWLLRRRIRVFEFHDRVLHQKMLLADARVTLGSCNFDRWGLRWNLEANQTVESPELAAQAAAVLTEDFAHCHEITQAERERLSLWQRLTERFWGWIDGIAARAAQRRLMRGARSSRPED